MKSTIQRRTRGGTVRFKNLAEAQASPILSRPSAAVSFGDAFLLLRTRADGLLHLVQCGADIGDEGKAGDSRDTNASRKSFDKGESLASLPSISSNSNNSSYCNVNCNNPKDGDGNTSGGGGGVVLLRRRSRAASLVISAAASLDSDEGPLHLDPVGGSHVAREDAVAASPTAAAATGVETSPSAASPRSSSEGGEEEAVSVISVGGCVQGWRRTMEDRLVIFAPDRKNCTSPTRAATATAAREHTLAILVLDGHRGSTAVDFVATKLPLLLSQALPKDEDGDSEGVASLLVPANAEGSSEAGNGPEDEAALVLGSSHDEERGKVREVAVRPPLYDAVVNAFLDVDGQLLEAQVGGDEAKAASAMAGIWEVIAQYIGAPGDVASSSVLSVPATGGAGEPLLRAIPSPPSPRYGAAQGASVDAEKARVDSANPPRLAGVSCSTITAEVAMAATTTPTTTSSSANRDDRSNSKNSNNDRTSPDNNAGHSSARTAVVSSSADSSHGPARKADGDTTLPFPLPLSLPPHHSSSPRRSPCSFPSSATNHSPRDRLPPTPTASVGTTPRGGGAVYHAGPPIAPRQRRLSVSRGFSLPDMPGSTTSNANDNHHGTNSCSTTNLRDSGNGSNEDNENLSARLRSHHNHNQQHYCHPPSEHRSNGGGCGGAAQSITASPSSPLVTAGAAVRHAMQSVSLHGGRGFGGALFPEDEDKDGADEDNRGGGGGGGGESQELEDRVLCSSLTRSDNNSYDTNANAGDFYTSHRTTLTNLKQQQQQQQQQRTRGRSTSDTPQDGNHKGSHPQQLYSSRPSTGRVTSLSASDGLVGHLPFGSYVSIIPTPPSVTPNDLVAHSSNLGTAALASRLSNRTLIASQNGEYGNCGDGRSPRPWSTSPLPPTDADAVTTQREEASSQPVVMEVGSVIVMPNSTTRETTPSVRDDEDGDTNAHTAHPTAPTPAMESQPTAHAENETAQNEDLPDAVDDKTVCEVDPTPYLADTSGSTALLMLVRLSAHAPHRVELTVANLGDCQAFLVERNPPSAPDESIDDAEVVEEMRAKAFYGYPPAQQAKPARLPRGFAFTKLTNDHRPAVNETEEAKLLGRFGRSAFLPTLPANGEQQQALEEAPLSEGDQNRLLMKRVGGRLAVSRALGDFDLKLSRLPVLALQRHFLTATHARNAAAAAHSVALRRSSLSRLLQACVTRDVDATLIPVVVENLSSPDKRVILAAAASASANVVGEEEASDTERSVDVSRTTMTTAAPAATVAPAAAAVPPHLLPTAPVEGLASALILSNVPEVRTFSFAPSPKPSSSRVANAVGRSGEDVIVPYKLLVGGCDGVWELQSIAHIAERAEKYLQPILQDMHNGTERGEGQATSPRADPVPVPASRRATGEGAQSVGAPAAAATARKWRTLLQEAMRAIVSESLQAGISTSQPPPSGGVGGDNMTLSITLILP